MNRYHPHKEWRSIPKMFIRKMLKKDTTDDLELHQGDREVIELTKGLLNDPEFQVYADECSLLVQDYKAKQSKNAIKLFRQVAVAAVMLVAISVSLTVYINSPDVYRSEIGEQHTIILADKSRITLNTNTVIKVKYSEDERLVWLEKGEAYFIVSPDKKRPFKVLAGNGFVRAVGTAFNVSVKDEVISVDVLEGSVDVLSKTTDIHPQAEISKYFPKKKTHLKVGDAVKYWSNGIMGNIEVAAITRIKSWREGKLRFKNLNLVDALYEHNRYTDYKIVIGSQEIRFLKINGVFEIGDTDSLLFLLEASLGLKSVKQSNVIVLFSKDKIGINHETSAQLN